MTIYIIRELLEHEVEIEDPVTPPDDASDVEDFVLRQFNGTTDRLISTRVLRQDISFRGEKATA